VADALTVLQASLAERLAELRGVALDELPESLLNVVVRPVELPGGEVYIVRPADWEALRDYEGMAPCSTRFPTPMPCSPSHPGC
jgi:hypothetical protein